MTTIQVRMDAADKKRAEEVFNLLGVDIPTAVRMFFKKVAHSRSIPFDLTVDEPEFTDKEVAEILRSSKDAEEGKNMSPTFTNMEDAIAYLNDESCE